MSSTRSNRDHDRPRAREQRPADQTTVDYIALAGEVARQLEQAISDSSRVLSPALVRSIAELRAAPSRTVTARRLAAPPPLRQGGRLAPRPRTPCEQRSDVSFPIFEQDQRWQNWGIVDLISADPDSIFAPLLFRPTNPYEIASAILQAENDNMTIRALGSGWSFSDVSFPQQTPMSPSDRVTRALDWFVPSDIWDYYGYAINTEECDGSLQYVLPSIALPHVDTASLFFVEAGIKLQDLNTLLDSQPAPLALRTLGGSAGQSLAGAISTSTHGGDFDRAPLADNARAIYLVGAGGTHYWIERSSPITDPNAVRAAFPCILAANIHYDDEMFRAALVSMGAMGVFYAVIVDVVPQYVLAQVNWRTTWEELKSHVGANLNHVFDVNEFPAIRTYLDETFAGLKQPAYRFLQVVVNPIRNQDGSHNCYLSMRFELSLDAIGGMPIPSGNRPGDIASLTSDDFLNAMKNQPEWDIGSWFILDVVGDIVSHFSGGSSGDLLTQAQKLIDVCKTFNYYWAVRAVIDLLFGMAFPMFNGQMASGGAPQLDIGHKVMVGSVLGTAFTPGQITSTEAAFPLADAVTFIDSMLEEIDARIPNNLFPAGYLSLRVTGPSEGLLAMQQFGSLPFNYGAPDCTGSIEMSLLGNPDDISVVKKFEELALAQGGLLHWGQSIGLMNHLAVQERYPALDTWKSVQAKLGGQTFVNLFMHRCGLI